MKTNAGFGHSEASPAVAVSIWADGVYPRCFSRAPQEGDPYLGEHAAGKLAEFFNAKGITALKEEDRNETWYEDWLVFQAEHRIYASVLSPKQFSTLGYEFDLLKLTRFLEAFAYFSPSHGYSLQTTFLGLFAILMGSNADLKREAVAALEAGELLAFGVSEKDHGSDLLGNEFIVTETAPGQFVADGRKYYIGNANRAAIISILARKDSARSGRSTRSPFVLFALRPGQSPGYRSIRKIRTLGVRAAFVGEFEVRDHPLSAGDVIAEGRDAWDAVLGTVTLGKFFLGFGSLGICEHALEEATAHLRDRMLYRKPALEMPHIRLATAQAYARLTAMKLYAFRALDYVHAAGAADRRYLLFCAVQKAKVSTEGVKVISQLSECIGAKGFESDTYFESALRDIQLIPGLEGSTHINLSQTVQFISRYFTQCDPHLADPESLTAGHATPGENPYLMEARTGAINTIAFPHFLKAYRALMMVRNVRVFARQIRAFRMLIRARRRLRDTVPLDQRVGLAWGQCMATIAYGQLVAENAHRLNVGAPMISAIFHLLVCDLSAAAQALGALPGIDAPSRILARRMIQLPETTDSDWNFVSAYVDGKPPQPAQNPAPLSNSRPATHGSFLWWFLRIPARIISRLLFDLKVHGLEHVPKRGGVLIVSNHQSNLDPLLIGVELDRPLNYIAKSELFHRRFARWLLRSLNAFPVRQGRGDVGAIKETIHRLQHGHLLNIYPEGARTPDGRMQPLKKGVALIIKRTGVPIIPAVIIGTFEAWPIQRRFPRPGPVRVRFGSPIEFDGMESDEAIMAVVEVELGRMFAQMQEDRSRESITGS